MRPLHSYALGVVFTVLLFLAYVTLAPDVTYYPTPRRPAPDLGKYPLWFIDGCVLADHQVFRGFEFAFAPRAPLLDSIKIPDDAAMVELLNKGPLRQLSIEDDRNACSPPVNSDLNGTIVLVGTGDCVIATKIMNCQAQGAIAVVTSGSANVAEAESGPNLVDEELGLQIPGLVLRDEDFEKLVGLAKTGPTTVSVWTLTPDINASFFGVILLLFIRPLIMVSIVLLVVFGNLRNQKMRKRAPAKVVAALPTRNWAAAEPNEFDQSECCICLANFGDGEEITVLPCQHEFHTVCISRWLLRRRGTCPLCFQEVNERTALLP